MIDFALKLLAALLYSFSLAGAAVFLCLPFCVFTASLLRNKNRLSAILLSLIDVLIALPHQILLLTLAGILGGSAKVFLLSVFLTQTPPMLRHFVVHFERAYASPHIEAVRALGLSPARVFFRHVLPRLWAPLSVATLSLVKRVILSETLLSFLGLGFDPLTPSLGRLLSEGREQLFLSPALFLTPMLTLLLGLYVLQRISDRYSSLFKAHGVRYL